MKISKYFCHFFFSFVRKIHSISVLVALTVSQSFSCFFFILLRFPKPFSCLALLNRAVHILVSSVVLPGFLQWLLEKLTACMDWLAYDYTSFTKHLIVTSTPQECALLELLNTHTLTLSLFLSILSLSQNARTRAHKPEFKVHETYLEVFTFQQTDRHTLGYLLFQIEKIKCNKRRATLFLLPFSDIFSRALYLSLFLSFCRTRSSYIPFLTIFFLDIFFFLLLARLSALC